ncbi:MAG: phosphoribosylanthranilate isomerase [Clostridiaceae bacterium]|nr:phosphoribosylanthranilate isomerase [Clostridiaceae bacterium]
MKIKICGLTKPEEAAYLNENHVDFAGFVLFCPKSKRNNTIKTAEKIMEKLDASIQKTAVVVSPAPEQILAVQKAGFDYIQIHGNLSEEARKALSIPAWKAFNVNDMEQYPFYHSCDQITGYVFDAQEPGSGKTFDWKLLKKIPRDEKLFLLAGGLHPGNVAEAAGLLHPDVVDVSSGVEYDDRPGKDPDKIAAFVKNCRNVR